MPNDEHDLEHDPDVERLRRHARRLDAAYGIPWTPWRWGLDSIVGLIPGIGDALGAGMALWVPYQAWKMGASKPALGRMVANIGIDALVGAVPVLGDVFDIWFRASERNLAVFERDRRRRGAAKRGEAT